MTEQECQWVESFIFVLYDSSFLVGCTVMFYVVSGAHLLFLRMAISPDRISKKENGRKIDFILIMSQKPCLRYLPSQLLKVGLGEWNNGNRDLKFITIVCKFVQYPENSIVAWIRHLLVLWFACLRFHDSSTRFPPISGFSMVSFEASPLTTYVCNFVSICTNSYSISTLFAGCCMCLLIQTKRITAPYTIFDRSLQHTTSSTLS